MADEFRLKIFLEVYKTGNFTKAARNLKITQASVSQNIKELETAAGCELFDRNTKPVSVTDSGRVFFEYAERMIAMSENFDLIFNKRGYFSKYRTNITIKADECLLEYVVPRLISMLKINSPDLNIEVVERNSDLAADIMLSVENISENLDFTGKESVGEIYPAAVVAGYDGIISKIPEKYYSFVPSSSLSKILQGYEAVLWSGYKPFLSVDMLSGIKYFSDSCSCIKKNLMMSSNCAAVLPYVAVKDDIKNRRLQLLPFVSADYVYKIMYTSRLSDDVSCMIKDLLKGILDD